MVRSAWTIANVAEVLTAQDDIRRRGVSGRHQCKTSWKTVDEPLKGNWRIHARRHDTFGAALANRMYGLVDNSATPPS